MPQSTKRGSLRNHLMSFLLGFACAYLLLNASSLNCSAKQASDECDCTSSDQLWRKGESTISREPQTLFNEKSFYEIAAKYDTDKILGETFLPKCLETGSPCICSGCERKECRTWGHWYHTIYQQRIGKYSLDSTEPFQFLEIGFYEGKGYETYRDFLSQSTEVHSMEISCLPKGAREEGKWPYGNPAANHKNYQKYLDEDRLHCGDASNLTFLDDIWRNKMHRPEAPPLKIVVDDGSHLARDMALTVFFWFPRIEPGGLLVVEDIQPINSANLFRTQFLPQIMSDLHYCGDPKQPKDDPCFPLLQRLLHSIHCEMHICIFERNQEPAIPDLPLANSTLPPNALDAKACLSIGQPWGIK